VQEAARYHIAIDTHEPIKDTGLRRTYPNWLSREGARGMEYNAWGNPINSVEHEANLIFTRMLSGPMDYTPGILSLEGVKGRPINSTIAKQLASFVVIYSPVMMAADLIENYEKFPGAFQFIKDVPTDWADTRVLHGAVGEYATIARKDRHSTDWYVGVITDGKARTLDLALDFLDPDKTYVAEIYRDGKQADYRNPHRHDIIIEKKIVTAKQHLSLHLAPGGGQAIRLKQSGG
jgi:alpha-glucosidase